jgi:cytochrome c-type biogenesis protein CcmH
VLFPVFAGNIPCRNCRKNLTGEFILAVSTMAVLTVSVLVLLGISGVLLFWRNNQEVKISAALRDLLLEQAAGKIDGAEFARRQAALHASLLEPPKKSMLPDRRQLRWGIPLAIGIIVVPPVVLYALAGKPKEAEISHSQTVLSGLRAPDSRPQLQQNPQANSGGDLHMAVKRLADKMAKDPGNGEGWLLLARTYGELRQHKEATSAYAKAAAILPPNAAILAEWVDARVLANERRWDDESRDIVKRALEADPKHLKALALAGSEAFDRADYKQAVISWKRMQAAAPVGSTEVKLAEMNIQEANAMLAGKKPN